LLVDRRGASIRARDDSGEWRHLSGSIAPFESIFAHSADPERAPEILRLREQIRSWRFYDHFRVDADAPARQPVVGTRTPVLGSDGRDLAAALQTIIEIGDQPALIASVDDAFPGATLKPQPVDGRLKLEFSQTGLLRPLSAAELSDGTLRYLLWIAVLLTPRPPSLMVLNEPETSLHPDLLPALARLIIRASRHTQLWVVSHASRLVSALKEAQECQAILLEKPLGQTEVAGQGLLDVPPWKWPER
jgi:predicted ATPase